MNNSIEVIGIDHGWSMIKTVSKVFVTGVKEITTTPALFAEILEYEGKYYKVGNTRQEVMVIIAILLQNQVITNATSLSQHKQWFGLL